MVEITVIFGDARNMKEVKDGTVHLVVTSPPYYNAPFDFPDLFASYDEFLNLIRQVGKELYRVLVPGRNACFVTQDVRIKGKLYPIVADIINILTKEVGFEYQEKIIWRKPEGYIRISRRSGVVIQHPYPLYYYPDNIYEEIIVFKKPGTFDRKNVPSKIREKSRIDIYRFQTEKWYLSVWDIKNVLPHEKWSKYTAAYPEELVERLITLYSYYGETVLDPFLGTGTTCVVAKRLGRNCIGYEVDIELKDVIEERLNLKDQSITQYVGGQKDILKITVRKDIKKLRTTLQTKIQTRLRKSKKQIKES